MKVGGHVMTTSVIAIATFQTNLSRKFKPDRIIIVSSVGGANDNGP